HQGSAVRSGDIDGGVSGAVPGPARRPHVPRCVRLAVLVSSEGFGPRTSYVKTPTFVGVSSGPPSRLRLTNLGLLRRRLPTRWCEWRRVEKSRGLCLPGSFRNLPELQDEAGNHRNRCEAHGPPERQPMVTAH